MRRLVEFLARVRGSLTRNETESRLAEEIEFHIDMHADRDIRGGADPDRCSYLGIVSMVVTEGARMAAIGIGFGVIAAALAARSLRTLVFGVATTDVGTYGGVAAVLALVALAASYIPARRASRVDPLIALRSD